MGYRWQGDELQVDCKTIEIASSTGWAHSIWRKVVESHRQLVNTDVKPFRSETL